MDHSFAPPDPPPPLPSNSSPPHPHPDGHCALTSCVLLTPAFLHSMCQVFCFRSVWGLQQCGIGLFMSVVFVCPDHSSSSASVFVRKTVCQRQYRLRDLRLFCFRKGLCRQTYNSVCGWTLFQEHFHRVHRRLAGFPSMTFQTQDSKGHTVTVLIPHTFCFYDILFLDVGLSCLVVEWNWLSVASTESSDTLQIWMRKS